MSLNLAAYIDHSILKPETKVRAIDKLCMEAAGQNFAAVCVPMKFVTVARKMLNTSMVKIATVIGFPLGEIDVELKVAEITGALDMGAHEVDMVVNLCALKGGDWKLLEREINACLKPVIAAGKAIKVIVESGILTDSELINCCKLYSEHKIDFMKTSTGFSEFGASVHTVDIMRAHLPLRIGIKASGGIRHYQFAKELIDAGATRLGCSASMQIMKESPETPGP
jgi:deoxyribose-phosphate aldolase